MNLDAGGVLSLFRFLDLIASYDISAVPQPGSLTLT
jgi:hypothetical protein